MERLPDPSDRRGVLVRLTDEGRDRADQALAGLLAQERALLAAPRTPPTSRRLAGLLRPAGPSPFEREA